MELDNCDANSNAFKLQGLALETAERKRLALTTGVMGLCVMGVAAIW